jgi:hypothetical protein
MAILFFNKIENLPFASERDCLTFVSSMKRNDTDGKENEEATLI